MAIHTVIKENTYFDSVTLMTISTRANELEFVKTAMVGMGTDMNIEVIRNVGLYTDALNDVSTGDLMIVVDIDEDGEAKEVLAQIDELFTQKKSTGDTEVVYKTLGGAIENHPSSNMVVISVNGQFAYREANQALDDGKHVMLFSDNVSIDEEKALKEKAHAKELLMMGPDCGTAIINGVGLCFANEVRTGDIGIVGASGTGSQEVSVQIHKHGYGVSQLIGTGGRDLSSDIGGLMMIDGIDALINDAQTRAILLVSKPPAKEVEAKILKKVSETTKPVVIYFIGSDMTESDLPNVTFTRSSLEAALEVIKHSEQPIQSTSIYADPTDAELEKVKAKLSKGQKYARGLFCGGTLCDELLYQLMDVAKEDVYSNNHPQDEFHLGYTSASKKHTILDFGDDEFTAGRPHPMIDPSSRSQRLINEARDPEVAAIVMDFELGFGSHADPAGVVLTAIEEAQAIAQKAGRYLPIVAYVLGTEEDRQDVIEQRQKLLDLGVIVVDSNDALCHVTKTLIEGA